MKKAKIAAIRPGSPDPAVFVYVRVSTVEQDSEAQMIGINAYLAKTAETVFTLISDEISGTIPWRDRGLAQLQEIAHAGDKLIISELSRIGRGTADVLDFLAWAAKFGLIVYAVKNNMLIDQSMQSKIFTTIMALAAEIERDFISQRTKEGMAAAAMRGAKIGRPSGPAKQHQLDLERSDIEDALRKGSTKAAIARLRNVSVGTIDRAIKCWKNQEIR